MRLFVAATSVVTMSVLLIFASNTPPSGTAAPRSGKQQLWIKIIFGVDEQSAQWDGRLRITDGQILDCEPYCLERRDRLTGPSRGDNASSELSWTITTELEQTRKATFAVPTRGFLAKLDVTDDSQLHVTTQQGDFRVTVGSLKPGRPQAVLNGRATVEQLGTSDLVWETESDDDFTTIAVDSRGHRHVGWIAYDDANGRNQLQIRNVDMPNSAAETISTFGEAAGLHLVSHNDALRAFWCSPGEQNNWDVYTAHRGADGWTTERLTSAEAVDCHLAVAARDERIWLCWQSFRDGQSDVYAKCFHNGRWSEDIRVTNSPANQWQPSLDVDRQGRAWIGYDSYQNGNYDVFLRSAKWDGQRSHVSDAMAIARSDDFEAHASVLTDDDRVWIAYDASGPGWGKDYRYSRPLPDQPLHAPLHATRRLELRCLVDGKVMKPRHALPIKLPSEVPEVSNRSPEAKPARFYEFPQLTRDGDGRLWLLFRQCQQGYCPHPPQGPHWNIFVTSFTRNGWLSPIEFPRSQGRQDQRVSCAVGSDGRLNCAWSEGNRAAAVNRKYTVQWGTLPAIEEAVATIPLVETSLAPAGKPDVVPEIPFTIERGREKYQVLFGDLHRHTNISRCSPTIDGCLTDAHRYALDAAQLDFLAVTDHTRDVDPFSWWRTQQASDLYHIPEQYITIYGYERSNAAEGGGHRNVFFLNRGWEVSRSDHWYRGRDLPGQDADPNTTLYPWLKSGGRALTVAHTPEYSTQKMRGTWTFNDPQVEPVAEIFQGCRWSYERPTDRVRREASVQHALSKGYRLGFIASSDHMSTHMSYACVWAVEKSREAIFEALESRRTYAATDRIGLDMRIGDALMGEETKVDDDTVTLSLRVHGTAAIAEIEIVRNGDVIGRLRPKQLRVETEYVDRTPPQGENYYYIRVRQTDGGLAWGSPIWVSVNGDT